MDELIAQVGRYGLLLVFANVFLEQVGLPIPALPTLIVAGALVTRGEMGIGPLLLVAIAGSVTADLFWFLLGRRKGYRILELVCRVSLSPDSCVRQTETLFERRGLLSLLFAKFIPGYSTVAPPLAGALGTRLGAFLVWDALGSFLWAGTGVVLGVLFHDAVADAVGYLETLGLWALAVLGAGLFLVIAAKWWQRRRLFKVLRLARISVPELHELIEQGEAPVVVDVRTRTRHLLDPRRIPGAVRMSIDELDEKLSELPRDREVILYCT
jgi:membrane protein DedA with SNARE-associated domain